MLTCVVCIPRELAAEILLREERGGSASAFQLLQASATGFPVRWPRRREVLEKLGPCEVSGRELARELKRSGGSLESMLFRLGYEYQRIAEILEQVRRGAVLAFTDRGALHLTGLRIELERSAELTVYEAVPETPGLDRTAPGAGMSPGNAGHPSLFIKA